MNIHIQVIAHIAPIHAYAPNGAYPRAHHPSHTPTHRHTQVVTPSTQTSCGFQDGGEGPTSSYQRVNARKVSVKVSLVTANMRFEVDTIKGWQVRKMGGAARCHHNWHLARPLHNWSEMLSQRPRAALSTPVIPVNSPSINGNSCDNSYPRCFDSVE